MPATLTVADLLVRIALARATPTLYLLGVGGFYGNEAGPHDLPGKTVCPKTVLKTMKQDNCKKYKAYLAAAQAANFDPYALPEMPACDCSGFVLWALNLARSPSEGHGPWINTTTIYDAATRPVSRPHDGADAAPPTARFRRDDSDAAPLATRIGAMLVYPEGDGHEVGHIGFVTQVDASGRPTLVVHCAPENFLLPPAPGAQRTAILETSPEVFFQVPRTIAVWCDEVAR